MLLNASGKAAKKARKALKNNSRIVKKRKQKENMGIWLNM